MKISYAFMETINNLFIGLNRYCSSTLDYNPASISRNNVFSKSIEAEIVKGKECFIPAIYFYEAIDFLSRVQEDADIIKISYPLFTSRKSCKNTAESIIRSIISNCESSGLLHVRTKNNLDYYGSRGIILDKDFNPLLLLGCHIVLSNIMEIKCIRPVCYISPEVFKNSDLVSKSIINKVIPRITSNKICVPAILKSKRADDELFNQTIVIVDNSINKFFKTPIAPTKPDFSDDVWKFLEANKDKLYVS